MRMPTHTHSIKHRHNKHPARNRTRKISPLTIEKGLSFLCYIWHHNLVYIFREAWPAWWGAPALCCNLWWGGAKMSHKSTFKNPLCCPQNPLVTFWSAHSCTKESVVFIAGTAIRIMRPKGLSISQKAWRGKNKLHLSPLKGPKHRIGL